MSNTRASFTNFWDGGTPSPSPSISLLPTHGSDLLWTLRGHCEVLGREVGGVSMQRVVRKCSHAVLTKQLNDKLAELVDGYAESEELAPMDKQLTDSQWNVMFAPQINYRQAFKALCGLWKSAAPLRPLHVLEERASSFRQRLNNRLPPTAAWTGAIRG